MGFSIELSGRTSKLGYRLNDPINLDPNKEWQICLTSFVVYNSICNVTEKNNEFVLLGEENDVPTRFCIPPGSYEVEDILNVIFSHKECEEAKFTATINPFTRKVKVLCKLKKIDFSSPRSIGQLLGFSPQIIERNESVFSDEIVNIYPVNSIRIKCNLIESNYENEKSKGNIVYSFPLNTIPGAKIVQIPSQLRHYPLNTFIIKDVFVEIVDQENRIIDFGGEIITLELYINSV